MYKDLLFQNGHGCPWFYAVMSLQSANSCPAGAKDVHSEAARMPLVLNSSDVFCLQKTRVQELTRMSILGQR